MGSIFNTLGIGYSGLNAAQTAIDTTGHNISNAETDGYTRQRVVTEAAVPLNSTPGATGNGVRLQQIARVFDDFVFKNYTTVSSDKESSDFTKATMQELSTYFPEIDNVGIKADLHAYFDLWQSFSDNPNNSSVKIALAQQTKSLVQHIRETKERVSSLQKRMNDEMKVRMDEVNKIAKQIADINVSINNIEADPRNNANDLRDKRSKLELSLANLVGAKVMSGQIESNNLIDQNIAIKQGSYSISISGFNIVDGTHYHPIVIDNEKSQAGMYDLYYERQDGVRIPFASEVKGGIVGSILNLRGSTLNNVEGIPTNGVLQKLNDELDMFAKGLIQNTNNIYAQSATNKMQSNPVVDTPTKPLVTADLGIKEGSFYVDVYDVNGNRVASREIKIDGRTSLTDGENSIKAQLEANKDDNDDKNANNDVDDLLAVHYQKERFSIDLKDTDLKDKGYTFAIRDGLNAENRFASGTNFAGALGLHRYFDGENANNIDLASDFREDPTKISAHGAPLSGDNKIAFDMVQSQFEKMNYKAKNSDVEFEDTVYGIYDTIATSVGTQTQAVVAANDTINAKYHAVKQQYDSISKVSIDEEMSNLIRYQTSYGAAAKVITTVDQMMNTLLGIKQ